jgi:glucuronate isomerase
MASTFLTEDFLLQTRTARRLYHEYAEKMPIYDYHCHLPAGLIAEDYKFKNLSEAWLAGDHYKWRAMRVNGVDERYITGDASDYEKFEKWAETVPFTLRNPLYHWTHLELKRYFGVNELLDGDNARGVYDACSEMLRSREFSVRKLLGKMNVKLVCTTESPLDTLEHHKRIREDGFGIKVYAAFRPDRAFATEDLSALNAFIDKLGQLCDSEIRNFDSYVEALYQRHKYFHDNGCRLSDYGLETAYAEDYTASEAGSIFEKIRTRGQLQAGEQLKFKSAILFELACMDAEHGWVMQLHLGALRNNNSRMLNKLGPDTGYDSIGDFEIARPLAKFLDKLNNAGKLPRTILYNLNLKDSAVIATMIGNFQDGGCPGKMQYGPAWWFLDQKDGIENHIEVLSNMGLLSRFIGMTTDSRSFLSFPRHEYFRRVLCNVLGGDVEAGLLANDMELLGERIQDICFNNARRYFSMALG